MFISDLPFGNSENLSLAPWVSILHALTHTQCVSLSGV
jgi:hypothetical protein